MVFRRVSFERVTAYRRVAVGSGVTKKRVCADGRVLAASRVGKESHLAVSRVEVARGVTKKRSSASCCIFRSLV